MPKFSTNQNFWGWACTPFTPGSCTTGAEPTDLSEIATDRELWEIATDREVSYSQSRRHGGLWWA